MSVDMTLKIRLIDEGGTSERKACLEYNGRAIRFYNDIGEVVNAARAYSDARMIKEALKMLLGDSVEVIIDTSEIGGLCNILKYLS